MCHGSDMIPAFDRSRSGRTPATQAIETTDALRASRSIRGHPDHESPKRHAMNTNTSHLHTLGQSLWLDNITRRLLTSGRLAQCIHDLSVTGLTSNPTIFEKALRSGHDYDNSIRVLAAAGLSGESLFFELALEDLSEAADLFRPIYDATAGVDGWVSLEVSPVLADNASATIEAASRLRDKAAKANLFIKIPGTPEGIRAIEEAIFDGVPVNVTLLFSCEHYVSAAQAYMRAIERRLDADLDPNVASVASLFVSRWDTAISRTIKTPLQNQLGLAIAMRTYKAYRELLDSDRWRRLARAGAPTQRLLWASTGTKDPEASDTLYVTNLAAPDTINTLPEKTLLAYADHGPIPQLLPADGGYCEDLIREFEHEGVNIDALASTLQRQGVDGFAASWHSLLDGLAQKCARPAMTA